MEEFDVCITCCKFYEKSSRVSIKKCRNFSTQKIPEKTIVSRKKKCYNRRNKTTRRQSAKIHSMIVAKMSF